MKIFILALALFIVGCGAPEPTPEKPPSEMTEAERKAEIQKILDKIDVQLPDNWEEMTRQERGEFLLPYLMQVEIVDE